jgi:threonine dehydrogenase-like Zn-dependent dehydrogenase
MTEGFDVGMEMSGVPAAFTALLEHMNHGGKVALLGIPPPNMAIDWNQVIFKGLEIKGIYGREMFETWYKMVAMLQSGSICRRSSRITTRSETSSRRSRRCCRARAARSCSIGRA